MQIQFEVIQFVFVYLLRYLCKISSLRVGVRLGEYNTESESDCIQELDFYDCADPPQDFGVEKIIPHDAYRPDASDQHNDIALLRLDRNVVFSGKYLLLISNYS